MIWVTRMQLERGTKATDWKAAPEVSSVQLPQLLVFPRLPAEFSMVYIRKDKSTLEETNID